jgi:hypothetical protein
MYDWVKEHIMEVSLTKRAQHIQCRAVLATANLKAKIHYT